MDKMAVVSCKSHECSDFGFAGWDGIFLDSRDLGRVCSDSITADDVTKHVELVSSDRALLGFEEHPMFLDAA